MSQFSISFADSGDLVQDGFYTESAAYDWLRENVNQEDFDSYIVEPEDGTN
jgi:hypothetical protein